jgi:hypothetical protein
LVTPGKKLTEVLEKAWMGGIAVQSDFFRKNPSYVALAASDGLITTHLPGNRFGSVWRITPKGCAKLFEPKEPHDS